MTEAARASETPDARERILDAAEQDFALHGFAGAGMKSVAAAAEVAQGLIHYHFGAKERLYEAVIERRAALINAGRLARLEAAEAEGLTLRAVFRAFFAPPLGPEGGGAAYARIFATLGAGLDRDRALVARCYDETARRFIAAIRRAEPRAGEAEAAWAYILALGALITVIGRDGRLERLSAGAATTEPVEETVERLAAFAEGGLLGLIGGAGGD